ncbi:MAG: glycosyl hydrolase, partial [Candidatus Aminicenantes bacterium]
FPGIPERTYVNEVLASQHDRNTVYAAFNNHKSGDFKPYILKSTDLGNSWVSISSNLPERGSVYALAEDHVNQDLLFAGTEFGLFFTVDGGQSWKQLKAGLPVIAIRDIAIQTRENDLVLASFGRGFYVLDDYTPLRDLKSVVDRKEAHIFPVKKALMFVESAPLGSLGTQSKAFQGENYFTAPNPPVGATFNYYIKDDIKTLEEKRKDKEQALIKEKKPVPYPTYEQLRAEEEEKEPYLIFSILDEDGTVIRTLRGKATAGFHRMNWDLKYPGLNPIRTSDTDPTRSGPSSTFVLPGTYKVFLSKFENGEVTKLTDPVHFEVVTLANVSLPAEDRAELVEFQKKVRELSRAISASTRVLGDISEKIGQYREALKSIAPDDELISDIDALENKVKALRIEFYSDTTMQRADKDAVPGIYRRVRNIAYEQSRSTSAPTQTQRDAYAIAADRFEPALARLKAIASEDVVRIEKRLEGLGAPYTPGRLPVWKKN